MDIYKHNTTQEILNHLLKGTSATRPRGSVKKLAEHLKCHSTFISHVVMGKASLNFDQAYAVAKYYEFTEEEQEFFFLVLHKDKAGTKETQNYYESKMKDIRKRRFDLTTKIKATHALTKEDELTFFQNWIPQAVHLICNIRPGIASEQIAETLQVSKPTVEETLITLTKMGLIKIEEGKCSASDINIHLSQDRSMIRLFHSSWRQKVLQDLFAKPRDTDLHFSSLMTLSESTLMKIREMINEFLAETRELVIPDPSDKVVIFNIDYYELIE